MFLDFVNYFVWFIALPFDINILLVSINGVIFSASE